MRSTLPPEVSIIRKISRQRRMFTRRNGCLGSISSIIETRFLTSIKCDRSKIVAALISSPMRCHSVGCGMGISYGGYLSRPLTACAVITVLAASMVMMPNPGALNDWPEHWDMGIHYVRPRKMRGDDPVLVFVCAIAAHTPRKQNKAPKQHE